MRKPKMSVYITPKALEEIVILDDDYVNLNSLFKRYAVLLLDMTDEEWDELSLDTENDLVQFVVSNDVSVIPLHEYFDDIKENPSLISEKPRAMFFLDVSSDKAQRMSKDYGVIVQADSVINDKCLAWRYTRSFYKDDILPDSQEGWKQTLNLIPLQKGNSIVITDNYLLTNESNGKYVGCENIKHLLNAVLPDSLSIPYHVLIFCQHPEASPELANRIVGNMKSYLSGIRDYEIRLEVVFDKTIHTRELISNYYVLHLDKGFKLFKVNKNNQVYDDNYLNLVSIGFSPSDSYGDSEFQMSEIDLNKLKDLSDPKKTPHGIGGNDSLRRTIGDCKKDKSLSNRLIDN